jgi:hypothetical protein
MKNILLIFTLLIFFHYFSVYSQTQEHKAANSSNKKKVTKINNSDSIVILPSYKDPCSAFFFSFCLAGLGQAYNGEGSKAIKCLLGEVFGFGMIFYGGQNDDTWSYGTYRNNGPRYPLIVLGGVILCLVVDIYSIIDAPVTANKINEKSKEWLINHKLTSLNLNPIIKQNFAGIELSYKF